MVFEEDTMYKKDSVKKNIWASIVSSIGAFLVKRYSLFTMQDGEYSE